MNYIHLPSNESELWELVSSVCDGQATSSQYAHLEELFKTDPNAIPFYIWYGETHASLAWRARGGIPALAGVIDKSEPRDSDTCPKAPGLARLAKAANA